MSMRDFWDARAREDAYHFIENRLEKGNPDLERFWSEGEEIVDAVLAQVGSPRVHGHVVEVGCGIGRLTRVLAARAERVTAIDVSPEMLARARGHNPALANVDWVLGDGTSLAGVEEADCVFSHVVFQHLPDPAITYGYVRDMGRVLRDWAVFQVSNDPRIHRRRWFVPRSARHPAWRGSAVDLDALAAAAREGGLTLEQVSGPGTQFCYVRLSAT